MAKHYEVLAFLRPNGGYVQVGEDFDGIDFIDCEPFTKAEYENSFALVDAAKEKAAIELAAKKLEVENKLAALGLTIDDLRILGLA